jgi:CxxC motif-containing protein (DUF1111 family)
MPRRSRSIGLALAITLVPACLAVPALARAGAAPDAFTPVDDRSPQERGRARAMASPPSDPSSPEPSEAMAGGDATATGPIDRDAFSRFSGNLDAAGQARFARGHALFRQEWVPAPAAAFGGLGPLFNARSCESCHIRDGRGHPPDGAAVATSLFLRLSRAPRTPEEQALLKDGTLLNLPDPAYGGQFQDQAVYGVAPEGRVVVRYEDFTVTLGDGTEVAMRRPDYSVTDLAHGPMDVSVTLSPRVASPMIGLGLIEQIHPADILALADPGDADGDGISGRANIVRDAMAGEMALGRFGWKAQTATIRQQAAEAFAFDMGISTPDVPKPWGDCTPAQAACREMAAGAGEDPEAPEALLDLITFYSRHVAVPARRDVDDPEVLRGRALFHEIGCAACHTPRFVTRADAPDAALAGQIIWPYSDFLLHDMGLGLTDWQIVGEARGGEWRTPPLWGIGLTRTVSGHTFFLHDGRARDLTEAILWHGGEGEASRDGFKALGRQDREALIRFLESL